MSRGREQTRTLQLELRVPQAPAKVWRALVKSWLVEQWLMSNDLVPEVGRRFTFRAQGGGIRCEVLTVDEPRTLVWRWGDGTTDGGTLRTTVTWTLASDDDGGTLLRLEHAGFRARDERAFETLRDNWPRVLERLAEIVAEGR